MIVLQWVPAIVCIFLLSSLPLRAQSIIFHCDDMFDGVSVLATESVWHVRPSIPSAVLKITGLSSHSRDTFAWKRTWKGAMRDECRSDLIFLSFEKEVSKVLPDSATTRPVIGRIYSIEGNDADAKISVDGDLPYTEWLHVHEHLRDDPLRTIVLFNGVQMEAGVRLNAFEDSIKANRSHIRWLEGCDSLSAVVSRVYKSADSTFVQIAIRHMQRIQYEPLDAIVEVSHLTLLDLHVESGRISRYEFGSTYTGYSPAVREQMTVGTTEEIRYQWSEAPE